MAADRVEEAARRYVPGVGAVSVERLGRGLVNESHRVLRDGRMYSLRMPAAQRAATHVPIGVDREWECRVLVVASAAGIAPVIERCEPRLGVLVAFVKAGLVASNGEARRQIKGGGLKVNDTPVTDEKMVLTGRDPTPEGVIKLSLGRKRHVLLRPV